MKKLLVALVAFSAMSFAYADTKVDFDQSKMECKKTKKTLTLSDGIKKTEITKSCTLHPKHSDDPISRLRFVDDNSHKEVYCEFDKMGNITKGTCFVVE